MSNDIEQYLIKEEPFYQPQADEVELYEAAYSGAEFRSRLGNIGLGVAAVLLTFAVQIATMPEAWARSPEKAVSMRDSDGDGRVSRQEWDGPPKAFNNLDANGDGYITADEFARAWGMAAPAPAAPTAASASGGGGSGVIIADVHMHPHPDNAPEDVLVWMDRNNVQWAGLGAIIGGRDVREHYAQVMGNRYIAFDGQSQLNQIYRRGGNAALEDADRQDFKDLMAMLAEDFAAGKLKGVGEIFANANTTSQAWVGRKMRIDAPTNRAMLDLVAKHGGVLSMHVEWDSDSVAQLGELAASNPQGRIIIAHCGSNTSAVDIRTILKKHQNLFCDLSARHPPKLHPGLMRKKPEQKIFTASGLERDWRDLIEDMPDRFMVGTDTKTEQDYGGSIAAIRSGLLANLSAETAEKVAYKNAEALLNLQR